MPAVAVTDRNNLFGALEFSQYAAKAGIQPIVGCDLAIRREEEGGIATAGKLPPADWLTLLVQSEQGYLNLMRLVSRAHLEFKTGSLRGPAARRAGRPHRRACWPDRQRRQRARPPAGGGPGPGRDASARAAAEAVRRPALCRAAAPRRGQPSAASRRRCSTSPTPSGLPLVATNDVHFPKAVDVRGARRAALHRRGRAHRGSEPPPADARALVQVGGRDARSCSPTCRRPATTPWSIARRCAFMPEPRKPILPSYTKLERPRRGARRCASMARDAAWRRCGRAAGWPTGIEFETYQERLELRARHDREDGLRRLLPDRRRLHQLGQGQRHARSGRAAARAPARWSPMRSGSPTSTRCATTCCSSASSIPSACRCPTSTSTSARTGATG